jgi:DeoR/GlpR family transcriptional regulator of sugar metabolism/ABC-type sugar transport system substrate-binding protein
MKTVERLDAIVARVDERGFLSVKELSELCQVSEVTIRRDLERLEGKGRVQRTYGGAVSTRSRLATAAEAGTEPNGTPGNPPRAGLLADRVDVLITTTLDSKYDALLPDLTRKRIPVIAESLPLHNADTVVTIDNYGAGLAIGRWAGEYVQGHFGGRAYVLDLTYQLSNTQARSQGFLDGLRTVVPNPREILSINAQSRHDTACQLTHDAFIAHRKINVIFAINDITAAGALAACQDLNIDPRNILIIPFGLEGDGLKDALATNEYVKAGIALFPEMVGPVLLKAAIAAYRHETLPAQLLTPFAVVTRQTLAEFYRRAPNGWQLLVDRVRSDLPWPAPGDDHAPGSRHAFPRRIGFLVRFMEHEWYQVLVSAMRACAQPLGIRIEVVDADQTLREELELRRREIARCAADEIGPGDVILIDEGPAAGYLADQLINRQDITVVTNAARVFDTLRDNPHIVLISTGGALRRSTQVLVGPTAEATLGKLRADKLFLMVAGITLDFGLSHTDISEVGIKQAMIRSARTVILLADHTCFGHESMVQVAPATVVHKLITDDALPAHWRLELSRLGIQVALAGTRD